MEPYRSIIHDDKELLDHFLSKTITSMFEIPTDGRNGFNSNKITLEREVQKYVGKKVTPEEKDFFSDELEKIVSRIQDFSVADLNDPLVFASEENNLYPSKKDEVVACRYNIRITASDLKRVTNGNWYNTKIVDFYVNYLTEKLGNKISHDNLVVLPSIFFQPINARGPGGDVSGNYQEAIELLMKRSDELKRGEQNIFRIAERMFFVCNVTNSHWVIVEAQRGGLGSKVNRSPMSGQEYDPMNRQGRVIKGRNPKYSIILYDSQANYVKPEEHAVLKTMRTFFMYTLRKWGVSMDEEDFDMIYAETVKQDKVLESGAYICKFLDLLYQKREPHNSHFLLTVKPIDVEFFKNELKDLIQSIGFKNVVPDSVFSRF